DVAAVLVIHRQAGLVDQQVLVVAVLEAGDAGVVAGEGGQDDLLVQQVGGQRVHGVHELQLAVGRRRGWLAARAGGGRGQLVLERPDRGEAGGQLGLRGGSERRLQAG